MTQRNAPRSPNAAKTANAPGNEPARTPDAPAQDRFDALLDLYLPDRETVNARRRDDPPPRKKASPEASMDDDGERLGTGDVSRAGKGRRAGKGTFRRETGSGAAKARRATKDKAGKADRTQGKNRARTFCLEGRLEYADGRGRVVFAPNRYGLDRVPVHADGQLACAPGDHVRIRFVEKAGKALRWSIEEVVARTIEPFRLQVYKTGRKTGDKKPGKDMGAPRAWARVPATLPVQDGQGFFCDRLVVLAAEDRELQVGDLVVGRLAGEEEGRHAHEPGRLLVRPLLVHPFASHARHEELVRLNHGAPGDFPERVQNEARRFARELSKEELAGRLDLRDLCLVTLDGATARDFDDAVCVRALPDGGHELVVAIADVSHYVRANSPLDKEALKRGNSWYFPTSVAPMLPFELSNGLCSLVPHEDRLAVSVRMELDARGHTKKASFDLAVMRSKARLTYDEALALVEGPHVAPDSRTGAFAPSKAFDHERVLEKFAPEHCEGHDVRGMLQTALGLARTLKKRRLERGALDMNLPDWEAVIENDRLADFAHVSHHAMHGLVEEFMIRANEVVAEHLSACDLPFLYRVHDEPSTEKLCSLTEELVDGGLLPHGRLRDPLHPGELFALVAKHRDSSLALPVARACVRSLPLAVYSDENIGHFGLASKAYCHFTSPIRRGADLLVHRVLKTAMGKDQDPVLAGRKLKRAATALSDCERSAQLAEREMARRLAVLWLLNQERGQEYEGLVLSRNSRFAKVQLEDVPVEGALFASRGRPLPKMGARLRLVLDFLDIEALQADFREARHKRATCANGRAGTAARRD